jgi:hypothetical protein
MGQFPSMGQRQKKHRRKLLILARPERFELPTAWFVARYSIQLSYGRVMNGGLSLTGRCRSIGCGCAFGEATDNRSSARHPAARLPHSQSYQSDSGSGVDSGMGPQRSALLPGCSPRCRHPSRSCRRLLSLTTKEPFGVEVRCHRLPVHPLPGRILEACTDTAIISAPRLMQPRGSHAPRRRAL